MVTTHIFDLLNFTLFPHHIFFTLRSLSTSEVSGLSLSLTRSPEEFSCLLEILCLVSSDADSVRLDNHPGVLSARREWQRTTVELVIKLEGLANLHRVWFVVLVVEQVADVDACVTFVQAVSTQHVEGELLEGDVLHTNVVFLQHADDCILACTVRVCTLEQDLHLQRLAVPVHSVV